MQKKSSRITSIFFLTLCFTGHVAHAMERSEVGKTVCKVVYALSGVAGTSMLYILLPSLVVSEFCLITDLIGLGGVPEVDQKRLAQDEEWLRSTKENHKLRKQKIKGLCKERALAKKRHKDIQVPLTECMIPCQCQIRGVCALVGAYDNEQTLLREQLEREKEIRRDLSIYNRSDRQLGQRIRKARRVESARSTHGLYRSTTFLAVATAASAVVCGIAGHFYKH